MASGIGLTFDEPVIEPGRAGCCHLRGKINVQPVGKNEGGRGIVGAAELAHLDDASDGRRMLESLDPPEAHIVGAAVGTVDHSVGFACQLVVQPFVDHPAQQHRSLCTQCRGTRLGARGRGHLFAEGTLAAARAKAVVLACWNMMIPYLCPELPARQKDALHYLVKTPLVYASVAIRKLARLQGVGRA
jgi:hypothetical protein